ncbi:CerR family C-terminal domain-containing protein [Dactylosporangium sp. AC04546]|uniref:CerR family C-terminal domain-containing protein n=1 Tax=Dactylosporangium sp. AC04546 TaxID=2862460 RepID=UPI001EDE9468|nr:CerR family C-terminal domain-containing protein [Dactylosporangium sp. AC04546]WVK86629.1 CerR family C-terminal domain-containing protein [Dactylosporangium sp. AC04546]
MTAPAARAAVSRGDQTRESLLAAATTAFARDGYNAVSTRQIADLAQANQALIGYHFGGKEGLYVAVVERVATQIGAHTGPLLERIEAALDETREVTSPAALRDRLLPALLELTDGMAALLLRGDSAEWMQLILREQQTPTTAFDSLYSGFMGRVAALITEVAGRLRVDQDQTANRVLAATIMGQLVVFRSGHAGVMRHLGWAEVDDARVACVQQVLRGNVTALLAPPQA